MTNISTIQLKTIAGLLEVIDQDDEDDAKAAIKMIKALLGADKEAAK